MSGSLRRAEGSLEDYPGLNSIELSTPLASHRGIECEIGQKGPSLSKKNEIGSGNWLNSHSLVPSPGSSEFKYSIIRGRNNIGSYYDMHGQLSGFSESKNNSSASGKFSDSIKFVEEGVPDFTDSGRFLGVYQDCWSDNSLKFERNRLDIEEGAYFDEEEQGLEWLNEKLKSMFSESNKPTEVKGLEKEIISASSR
ncbi:hypothetical protein OJ253_3013 [Cryptosporidium canis]|uniref:Uncharacterized protein n=1 Tax=Cryptosporidium canis TaxID=195482 RepID=A0A9D5DHA2_9CRYT|nr:hypothetical protein OJ253_3013 [Cryptosporidium canis]